MDGRGVVMGKSGRLMVAGLFALGTWWWSARDVEAGSAMPWEPVTYNQRVVDMPVGDVVQNILALNAKNVANVIIDLKSDVTVTQEFNMPARSAFEKVLAENHLDFTYDEATRRVTVFLSDNKLITDIYIPRGVSLDELWAALARFEFPNPKDVAKEVVVISERNLTLRRDQPTGAILMKGAVSQVKEIVAILQAIDQGAKYRIEQEMKQQKVALDLTKQRLDVEEQVSQQQSPEYRIVKLKYASVTETTKNFQGKEVRVPGILNFLKGLLGSEVRIVDESGNEEVPTLRNASAGGKGGAPEWDPSIPRISADPRTNSVIIQGPAMTAAKIDLLIQELDKEEPVVEIEVLIMEGKVESWKSLGVNWGWGKATDDGSYDTSSTGESLTTASGKSYSLNTNDAGGSLSASQVDGTTTLGFLYGGTRKMLDFQLQALQSEGVAQTISAPRLVTMNNMPAKITSAQNLTFRGVTSDGEETSLETVNTGTYLDITPMVIDKDGQQLVRLDINVRSSQPVSSDANTSADSVVETNEEEIQTSVIIPENGTYVMGGMFKTLRSEGDTGIPGLKKIPLLGMLFTDESSTDVRSQVVFLLTPKVHPIAELSPRYGRAVNEYVEVQKEKTDRDWREFRTQSKMLQVGVELREDE